jgi:1-acyl-sn-glycerol-3-phosphate acyltransferase
MRINIKSGFLYYFGRFLFKVMFIVLYRCKSEGQENIPENSGVIIAPNHMSFFDPPLTGCFMKKDLFFIRFFL